MRFGALRDSIELQAPVRTPDGRGGYSLAWQTKAKVRANVQDLSGREYLLAQQLGTSLTRQVTMRYYAAIRPSWRIKLLPSGDLLNVRSVVNPDGKRIEHQLYCETINPSVD